MNTDDVDLANLMPILNFDDQKRDLQKRRALALSAVRRTTSKTSTWLTNPVGVSTTSTSATATSGGTHPPSPSVTNLESTLSGNNATSLSSEIEKMPVTEVTEMKRELDILRAKMANVRLDCVYCLDKPKCVRFDPCGHLACCFECAALLSSCPMCRAPIRERQRVYT